MILKLSAALFVLAFPAVFAAQIDDGGDAELFRVIAAHSLSVTLRDRNGN